MWRKMVRMKDEEKILINPLHPIYKNLLENDYDEEEIVSEIKKRWRDWSRDENLYVLPEKEVFVNMFSLIAATRFGSYSREASFVVDSIANVVKFRLNFALENEKILDSVLDAMEGILKVRFLDEIGNAYVVRGTSIKIPAEDMYRVREILKDTELPRYVVKWNEISEIFRIQDLTTLYLVEGWTPISETWLKEFYVLVLKEKLRKYIDEKILEYKEKNFVLPKVFLRIAKNLEGFVPKKILKIGVSSSKLNQEFFPPCVKLSISGVSAGLRNYAITILLTSFLSYARIRPTTKIFDRDSKFEISQQHVGIIEEEVVPLIREAGARCNPPFFEDQPLEIQNIYYHLGFGLCSKAEIRNFGDSKWYLPPSCNKIQKSAPSLCQPDDHCKTINNPLTYYITKKSR